VKRVEGPDLVVDLGKTEARVPKKEQSRLENFSVGERVRGIIKSVDKTGKNAGVLVSRSAPELVMRLFEQEVPEIYDGTVVIRGCAREAGERTKIAVLSRDRDVDCVGACVGMKGMRVQSIIRELRGEKIDIIEFSDDPVVFATHSLSPAKISRVAILDSSEKHMEVIVEDSQLSLAIGTPLSVLLDHQMQEPVLELLLAAGVGTVERLGSMTPEELELIQGIDAAAVEAIGASVNAYYAHLDAQTEAAAAEPAPAAQEAAPEQAAEAVEISPAQAEAEPPAEPSKDESDTMGDSGLPAER